jgi:hypothetical protein
MFYRISKVSIQDSVNTTLFSVQNKKEHPVGVVIINNPGKVTFYSSYTSRNGHGGKGFRMRYYVFSGSENRCKLLKNWIRIIYLKQQAVEWQFA